MSLMLRWCLYFGLVASLSLSPFAIATPPDSDDSDATTSEQPSKGAGAGGSTDKYLAKLNEPVREIPEDERAWPLYRKAIMRMEPPPRELAWHGRHWPTRVGDPEWGEAVQYLRRIRGALDLVHKAADRSRLGLPYRKVPDHEFKRTLVEQRGEPYQPRHLEEPILLSELYRPHLGPMRRLARVLTLDLRHARSIGDSERAMRDIRTMFSIARHTADGRAPTEASVAIGLAVHALQATKHLLQEYPSLLDEQQLAELATLLAELAPRDWGHETLEYSKLELLQTIDHYHRGEGDLMRAQREEAVSKTHEFIAQMDSFFEGNPWRDDTFDAPVWDQAESADSKHNVWQILIPTIAPGLAKVAHQAIQAQTVLDGLWVAVNAERHRQQTGAYPDSRREFSQEVRAGWPHDPFDGRPLRYRLRDGEPLIYAVGSDHDDDGGARPPAEDQTRALHLHVRWSMESWNELLEHDPGVADEHDGDWVLFPPAEDEETGSAGSSGNDD